MILLLLIKEGIVKFMKRMLRQTILSFLIKKGKKGNEQLLKLSYDAPKHNENLLMDILADNANTEYGRKYGFCDIHCIEEFKKRVPLTTYDDYRAYIRRMVDHHEIDVLTTYPIVHYNVSSATTSQKKMIPYTKQAVDVYKRYADFAGILAHLHADNDKKLLRNPILSCMTSNLSRLPNGITHGGLSEKMLEANKNVIELMCVYPKEIVFPDETLDSVYFQARFALAEPDISYCYLSFSTQLLQLIRYIEKNKELLLDDIAKGSIHPSINVSNATRKSLSAKVKPNPNRAQQLKREFDLGFAGILPRIWKSLRAIDAIAGGGFAIYTSELRYYLNDSIKINYYAFLASEGIFAICSELESEAALLVPDSCFFEFMPLGETDPTKTLGLESLVPGNEYELIITNLSGFYRYCMKDIIKVDGYYHACPQIHFSRRENQGLNLVGEKVSENDINQAMKDTIQQMGCTIIDYVVTTISDVSPMRYQFYIALSSSSREHRSEFTKIFTQNLFAQCKILEILYNRNMLGQPDVVFLKDSAFDQWRKTKENGSSNQYKLLHIINNPDMITFFNDNDLIIQTDDSIND